MYIPKLYNGKDQTFWFFAYGAMRNIAPSTQSWQAPTQAVRTLGYNPMLDSNWQGPVPGWRRDWTTSARIDPRFTEKDQFYARYTLRAGWEATACPARAAPARARGWRS